MLSLFSDISNSLSKEKDSCWDKNGEGDWGKFRSLSPLSFCFFFEEDLLELVIKILIDFSFLIVYKGEFLPDVLSLLELFLSLLSFFNLFISS